MSQQGRSICLYGDSGSGKTTQLGEAAKAVFKATRRKTVLRTSDLGGHESIKPLVKLGVVELDELTDGVDPWIWMNDAVSEPLDPTQYGLVCFDSGTSMGESLLRAAANAEFQVGQQKTQKFVVAKGAQQLAVTVNNEAHYGVVQGFMLEKIWKSMNLLRSGIDVIWTFSVQRGEEQDRTPILGPKFAGKALTPAGPKWFNFTWRIVSIPSEDGAPVHRLYLTEHTELAGMGHSFGNARYPLGATTQLPSYIEPASIPAALEAIEVGQAEAEAALAAELGL
jgi:hypothetical protein